MPEVLTPSDQAPPDQSARDRIATDLSSTLFVDAGAGSGKTAALVGRVVALVTAGEAELASVAAITFTEKAGAELRDRIRRELQRHIEAQLDTEGAARCRTALEQLDGAAIGTLHSFAQRILTEHPIEAGLPPRIEVLDEVSSSVAFGQRWTTFQDELLSDPTVERTLLLFFAAGVGPEALRSLAGTFEDNWDLVDEQVPDAAPEPPSVQSLFEIAAHAVRAVCAEPCSDPSDKLRLRLDEIATYIQHLESLDDELELLAALGEEADPKPPSFKVGNIGKLTSFADRDDVRARVAAAGDALAAVRGQVANACAKQIGAALRRFTLSAARERQSAGRLQFHDLLVLSRRLLRDPVHGPSVRRRLHDRYQRLLLDEFQDTDPIQIELAVRIAATEPEAEAAGHLPWQEVEVSPGALFLVGDPKQSIYRFRRADISTFLNAASRFGTSTGGLVELTANFRSVQAVIEWVNETFRTLMGEPDDIEVPVPSQPAYVALDSSRTAATSGPAVSVLGRTPHPKDSLADELREAEAREVASAVTRILAEAWEVGDGHGGWRPARLGDVTVLVPTRTSLPSLEDALEAAGIPYRAESSSLVYASREIRDLLMVLRAVDDPTNYLHIVAALRTPLLSCGDDDLFRFRRERAGRWSYLADQPESMPNDDPVRLGLSFLRSLYDERQFLTPSELLQRIVLERRALELGFLEGRPRDLWRRVRFLVDQARAWSEATSGNLRQYLAWVGMLASERARVAEAILPETDDDAVRILTIHAAKGLEFSITVVSGMTAASPNPRVPAQVVFPPGGDVGYRFGKHVVTDEFAEWESIEEQMEYHERIRLLYVACTRTRDHLVVSLHRKSRASEPKRTARTSAELLLDGMGALLDELPDAAGAEGTVPQVLPEPPAPPPPFDAWFAERAHALDSASRQRTVAATALSDEGVFDADAEPASGLEKRPLDIDLSPWLKGRYGTSVGRAVHGVLQNIDLAGGGGIGALVAAQCEAEAVPEREGDVRSLVEAALSSSSIQEAARCPYWREVYFCAPVEGRLLEGYVDLLYRADEGLVVVDYKTAATSDPAELERRVTLYRNQGASYALGISETTGEPVIRVIFVFLTPAGAIERQLPALAEAVANVRDLVASGREVLAS